MIPEIIKKKGEKGSGGKRRAFRPGTRYPWEKADEVRTRNVTGDSWQDVADEMMLTSLLNERVERPFYHVVLSWHPHEQPTNDQMFDAAEKFLKKMGLAEHQSVSSVHSDTAKRHIHITINTVHPGTGKNWSKSHDMMRAEQACREIELAEGWTHDRGRFDFDVKHDGTVELKPATHVYAQKKRDREDGKRPKTGADRAFEKSTGFESFAQAIPRALKDRFSDAVDEAVDWQSLHAALRQLGLTYDKSGSGARVGLVGSTEYVGASAFGARFSYARLNQRFGDYESAENEYANAQKTAHVPHDDRIPGVTGTVSDDDTKAIRSTPFQITLLRRIYTNIFVDPIVAAQIKYVDLKDVPPRITLRDNTTIVDHGDKITADGGRDYSTIAKMMIAMGQSKAWSGHRFSGPSEFVEIASLEAARQNLNVSCDDPKLQKRCDALRRRQQAENGSRLTDEARAARNAALADMADRDAVIDENDRERHTNADRDAEITAETEGLLDALGWLPRPIELGLRKALRDVEEEKRAALPDRRRVTNPQPGADADRHDRNGKRQIAQRLARNDHNELDVMRTVHIDAIAAMGGWSLVPKLLDGHNDRAGRDQRTYVRGPEAITATLKGAAWLWTHNKSGASGSVIDLWLADNPGTTLGDARKAFRDLIGTGHVTLAVDHSPIEPRDHTHARKRWEEAPHVLDQRTHAEDLGISKSTLRRFPDDVRAGVFGEVYFAHRNIETGDIQGFEQRWEKDGEDNNAHFAAGGLKSVCVLGDPTTATRMVVFDSGLDALALAEIEKRDDTIYVSTGGGFVPKTQLALKTLGVDKDVYSGFGNDDAGDALHKEMCRFLPDTTRHAPPKTAGSLKVECKDWLDVLNALKAPAPALTPDPAMPDQEGAAGEKGADVEVEADEDIDLLDDADDFSLVDDDDVFEDDNTPSPDNADEPESSPGM